jgi:hypothetical protein
MSDEHNTLTNMLSENELKEECRRVGVCYSCGRPFVPKDVEDTFLWLLRNDPIIRRAYDMGRHDQWKRERENDRGELE